MAQTPLNGLRLYGVAAFDSGLHHPLAEGTTLVQFRAIAGIVAPAKYTRAVPDAEELSDYTRVLEEVQANTAVLPAPLGTVFKSQDHLARWLELHYFTLTQAIGSIEGHGQARLTITKTPGIDAENATAGEVRESSKHLLATASQSMRVLRGQAAATVSLPVPEEDSHVVAHASFLVDLEKWSSFSDLVRKEDARHANLDFHLSGPWPPYDFVRMQFGG
ncbi:MAG TPA: GvpL/GvpF family gas vesicle protein [Gemmatimonadaceae bacterium]|nr:GvpL/GvpF family gas vesicle protein [Gemmatimonadaceae bacterium]